MFWKVDRTPQRKLTRNPAAAAKVHIDDATMAATFQFVDRVIVSNDGRFTDGPATSNATAAPTGAPDASSISARGISKKVGSARGTATAATTTMARTFAAVESNVRRNSKRGNNNDGQDFRGRRIKCSHWNHLNNNH